MKTEKNIDEILIEISELIDLVASILIAVNELEIWSTAGSVKNALNHIYAFEEAVIMLQKTDDANSVRVGLSRASKQMEAISAELGLKKLVPDL